MPDHPRPGMGQDEKDRLGQQAHELRQAELRKLGEERRDSWLPDDKLDGCTQSQLVEEADRRGLAVGRRAPKEVLLELLRGPEQPPAEEKPAKTNRSKTKDEGE